MRKELQAREAIERETAEIGGGKARAVLVDHAMAVSWTGLRALRKHGR